MQWHGSSRVTHPCSEGNPSHCSVKEPPKFIGSSSWTLMGPSFGLLLVSEEAFAYISPKETVPTAQSLLSQAGWGNLLCT